MDDVEFSRRGNEFWFGCRDEMFCARCYRRLRWWWPMVIFIDWRMTRMRGEPRGHCARSYAWERSQRSAAGPFDRFLEGQ